MKFDSETIAKLLAGLGSLLLLSGCGIHYLDPKTGVDHLWGFGHLRMRVPTPTNGVEAVIKGYTILGVKLGGTQEDYGLSLGYDDRRMIMVNPTNAAFGIEWPRAGWFNIRIGTNIPFLSESHSVSPDRTAPKTR
jgi:hypothetical protein